MLKMGEREIPGSWFYITRKARNYRSWLCRGEGRQE
jgi:hypothetical protein